MLGQERGCQGRILVVDQEEWCRAFLSSVIKLLGIEDFKLVNTVAEALAALEENPFDLIITDHRQPDCQLLHRKCPSPSSRHPLHRHAASSESGQSVLLSGAGGHRLQAALPGRNQPQDSLRHASETTAPGGRRTPADETGSLSNFPGVNAGSSQGCGAGAPYQKPRPLVLNSLPQLLLSICAQKDNFPVDGCVLRTQMAPGCARRIVDSSQQSEIATSSGRTRVRPKQGRTLRSAPTEHCRWSATISS